jgi:hypothetical protein
MNEISSNQSVRWDIASSRVAFDVSSLKAVVVGGEEGRGCQMMATKMTMPSAFADPLALLEALIFTVSLASRIRSHFSPPPAKIATLGNVSRDIKP